MALLSVFLVTQIRGELPSPDPSSEYVSQHHVHFMSFFFLISQCFVVQLTLLHYYPHLLQLLSKSMRQFNNPNYFIFNLLYFSPSSDPSMVPSAHPSVTPSYTPSFK